MISDLDKTIKQLLVEKASLNTSEITVSFNMPNRDWAASQSKPAINLYLYDIRENHELRSFDWTIEKNNNRTATRKKAPLRIAISYSITVWTKDIDDEHRLLGNILLTLMKFPVIPDEVCYGVLKGIDYPLHTSVAQPEENLKNPAEFWTAIDNQMKPAINYVITIPLDLDVIFTAPLVSTKTLEVRDSSKKETEEISQIGGTIYKKNKPEDVIPGANILVKELGISTKTDNLGHFNFHNIAKGKYTFEIETKGKATKEIEMTIPSNNYNIEL